MARTEQHLALGGRVGDVCQGYNDTVIWGTGMTPSRVCEKDVLRLLQNMTKRQERVTKAQPIYCVVRTVRISKEKMEFAKHFERFWTL
jgi:hypothetical protein